MALTLVRNRRSNISRASKSHNLGAEEEVLTATDHRSTRQLSQKVIRVVHPPASAFPAGTTLGRKTVDSST